MCILYKMGDETALCGMPAKIGERLEYSEPSLGDKVAIFQIGLNK